MNAELFIAKRIIARDEGTTRISRSIIRIAIVGIALGLTVMVLSVAFVTGFKSEIRQKVIGFGSHINIVNYDTNSSYETIPVSKDQRFYPELKQHEGIRHIQVYAIKAGIIKTRSDLHGVILKGISTDFDWSFFRKNLTKGEVFEIKPGEKTNKVLISSEIASLLKLDTTEHIVMYFIQNPPRVRKFKISGIYETGLAEYDERYVIGDIRHIQKLNDWGSDQVTGFEVLINDFDRLAEMREVVFDQAGSYFTEDENRFKVRTIKDVNPQIFDWLKLTDANVWVILGLMLIVAGFNMISGLLIMILERTNMIGMLKAMGYQNWNIRKVFLYNAAYLLGVGMFWGNVIGIALSLIQMHFGVLELDPASYYVEQVPVNLKLVHLLLLNAGTMVVTITILLLPSYLITRIRPDKAIRFE